MKNLLYSSIVLTVFSLSIILFQISCNDEVVGKTSSGQLNKILFSRTSSNTAPPELWLADYSGANQSKVNINLSSGLRIGGTAVISPDGQKIFFRVFDTNSKAYIYSCDLDGSNLIMTIDGGGLIQEGLNIQGAY